MTIPEFAVAIHDLCAHFGGSVKSWGRTDQHSRQVGGFPGDPHTWFLGADVVYDTGFPPMVALSQYAKTLGLKVIRETGKPHDHFQPSDMPAGPVASYGGKTRTLVNVTNVYEGR